MTKSSPLRKKTAQTTSSQVDVSAEHRRTLLTARGVDDPGLPDDDVLLDHGLTDAQVDLRSRAALTNVQPDDSSRSLATILRTHILTLFNLVIFLCALGIIALGRWLDMLFAIAAVSNVVIGVVQSIRPNSNSTVLPLLHQDGIHTSKC